MRYEWHLYIPMAIMLIQCPTFVVIVFLFDRIYLDLAYIVTFPN